MGDDEYQRMLKAAAEQQKELDHARKEKEAEAKKRQAENAKEQADREKSRAEFFKKVEKERKAIQERRAKQKQQNALRLEQQRAKQAAAKKAKPRSTGNIDKKLSTAKGTSSAARKTRLNQGRTPPKMSSAERMARWKYGSTGKAKTVAKELERKKQEQMKAAKGPARPGPSRPGADISKAPVDRARMRQVTMERFRRPVAGRGRPSVPGAVGRGARPPGRSPVRGRDRPQSGRGPPRRGPAGRGGRMQPPPRRDMRPREDYYEEDNGYEDDYYDEGEGDYYEEEDDYYEEEPAPRGRAPAGGSGNADDDWRAELRAMTGYDPRQFRDAHLDDRDMEARFADVEREEKISTRIGIREDEEDMEMERQELERMLLKKKKTSRQ
eukprot:Clim_evm41s152 gene=Clim_evmTU41s152